jgi:uncharacterized protein YlxP (DUF503 family)
MSVSWLQKRQYLRSLKANLARKLGASVAEVAYHELWQRSRIVLSLSSGDISELDRALDMAVRYIDERDYELVGIQREIINLGEDL